MIESISGIITAVKEKYIIVRVHGFGYGVILTDKHAAYYAEGMELKDMIIRQVINEHANLLYGFETESHAEIFDIIKNKIPGIGAFAAMRLLSEIEPHNIIEEAAAGNIKTFTNIKGIGSVAAKKIIDYFQRGNK